MHPLVAWLRPMLLPNALIWADQNANRPPKPYWTIKVRQTGGAPLVASSLDDQGMATYTEHQTLQVELQCYGPDAVALAETAARRMRLPSHAARAEGLGVGLGRLDPVRDLTALLDASQNEQRAMVEFTAHAVAEITDQVGLIEHAILECPAGPEGHRHVISKPGAVTPQPSP